MLCPSLSYNLRMYTAVSQQEFPELLMSMSLVSISSDH